MTTFKRTASQKPLSELISPEYFIPRGTGDSPVDSTTIYRIPAHQRFPSWPLSRKQKLVDSIFRDYPIHAIIAIRCLDYDGEQIDEYYNIEDGQTRMTVLQEYLLDKFPCEISDYNDISGKRFSELDVVVQQRFKNYQVTLEVFTGRPKIKPDVVSEIFNRLNSGKPLGDNDKYHSRMTSPIMTLLSEIKTHPDLRVDIERFIGKIGAGKTRKRLGDMVGMMLAVATRKSSHGGKACINTSYEQNHKYLCMHVSDEKKMDIIDFMKAYFVLLHSVNDNLTTKPNKNMYGKLSGVLGLSVCSWVNFNGKICDEIKWYVQKLVQNPKYEPSSFKELSKGDVRNCQGQSVARRLDKIIQQVNTDKDDNANTNGSESDEDYESDTE